MTHKRRGFYKYFVVEALNSYLELRWTNGLINKAGSI